MQIKINQSKRKCQVSKHFQITKMQKWQSFKIPRTTLPASKNDEIIKNLSQRTPSNSISEPQAKALNKSKSKLINRISWESI